MPYYAGRSPTRDIFVQALHTCRDSNPPSNVKEAKLLIFAVYDILKILPDSEELLKTEPSLIMMMHNFWPHVFKWIRFFAAQYSTWSVDERDEAIDLLSALINHMFLHDIRFRSFREEVAKDERITKLATRLWLDVGDIDDSDAIKRAGPLCVLPYCIVASGMEVARGRIVEEAGGDYALVAQTALRHLDHMMQFWNDFRRPKLHEEFAVLKMRLDPVLLLVRGEDSKKLYNEFIKAGMTQLITKALDLLLDDEPEKEQALATDLQVKTLALLSTTLATVNKASLVKQLLQNGLLRVLAIVGGHKPILDTMDEILHGVHLIILSGIMPNYLIYPAVLEEAVKQIKAMDPAMNARASQYPVKFMYAWQTFFAFVLDLYIIKRFHDRQPPSTKVVICDNCFRTDENRSFKQCARCKYRYYCCRACQTAAWSSHKEECKEIAIKKDATIRHRDQMFINAVARWFVRRHLPGLRQLAAKQYPSIPLKQLGIFIGFTQYQPTLDVVPLDANPRGTNSPSSPAVPTAAAYLCSIPPEERTQTLLVTTVHHRRYSTVAIPSERLFAPFGVSAKHSVVRTSATNSLVGKLESCGDPIDVVIARAGIDPNTHCLAPVPLFGARELWKRIDDIVDSMGDMDL